MGLDAVRIVVLPGVRRILERPPVVQSGSRSPAGSTRIVGLEDVRFAVGGVDWFALAELVPPVVPLAAGDTQLLRRSTRSPIFDPGLLRDQGRRVDKPECFAVESFVGFFRSRVSGPVLD